MGDGVEETLYEEPVTLHQVGVRLHNVERKVDHILVQMNKALGAWMLVYFVGGMLIGIATVYAAFK